MTKKWRRPVGLLAFTSWQLIAGGLFLVPLVAVFERRQRPCEMWATLAPVEAASKKLAEHKRSRTA